MHCKPNKNNVNIAHAQVNKQGCGHRGVVMVPEALPEKLEPMHGLKVIHGSQRVEREPGNERCTEYVLQNPTVQITDFMFIDVSGKTPLD